MSRPDGAFAAALADRYELLRELGAGGMATVYLARDVRHNRQVALKVLHPELSAVLGPERFLKEIALTASLQHPHILPLFDSGEAAGQLFYVMPYVEGETLRARLERENQLPIADAVLIAREVADALQYAHERGVIHRDIKPENILLQGGHALVADFGIALAVTNAGGARMTQTGLSLGTPQYMAPEQAMGERTIDARADIYALGAVTYEMLAGEPPFTGPTSQAIVAKVMSTDPQRLDMLRRHVPGHVADAVHEALEKLPADRFATARQFAEGLIRATGAARSVPARGASRSTSRSAVPQWGRVVALAVASVGLVALGTQLPLARNRRAAGEGAPTYLVAVPLPDSATVVRSGIGFAVRHDGRALVYVDRQRVATGELVLHALDSLENHALPGTAGAVLPFWSPDDRQIGFFAEGELRTIDLATRSVRRGCAVAAANGGTWGKDGVILIGSAPGSLRRTSSALGSCDRQDFSPLSGAKQRMAVMQPRPQFLGDGVHFIFVADDSVYLAKVGESWTVALGDAPNGSADLALPSHLLRRQPDGTYVQRIDVDRRALASPPQRILPAIEELLNGGLKVSSSAVGSLVARFEGAGGTAPLLQSSAAGLPLRAFPRPSQMASLALARNARTVALAGPDLQLLDLARGVATRVYAPEAGSGAVTLTPVFSPGDTLLAFVRRRNRVGIDVVDVRTGLVRRLVDAQYPGVVPRLGDWSRDGTRLLFANGRAPDSVRGAWTYNFTTGRATRLFDDRVEVHQPRYSPDEQWIAYVRLDADGRHVYLRRSDGSGLPLRVSTRPGRTPRWRRDGRALFFVGLEGTLHQVEVELGNEPRIGREHALFPDAVDVDGDADALEPMPDGSFLHVPSPPRRPLSLVLNWPALLNDAPLRGGR